MRKKYRQFCKLLYLLLFISLGHVYGQASFTTSPVAVNGTIALCQGNTITYTNTSTGTNNNTNYNWTFQGGTPNTLNQIGPHTVTYNNAGNFTTTLSLGAGNTSTVNIIVTNNVAPLAVLTIQNIGQFSSIVYNGATIFRKCGGSSIGNFNFNDTNIASNPAGTTYLISWGDNTTSTIPAGATPQWPHTYMGQGNYTLSYTVTFPGGCTTTSTYQVYVGNYAPAITLAGSGSSSCLPNNYSFTLGTGNTTPSVGTTFQVIYNDGSPVTIINGLGANNLDTIFHQFTNTSCGVNSTIQSSVYQNAYAIQVLAINGCSPQGTFGAIGPISVANSVDANFVASPAPYSPVCVNSAVQYNDVSDPGSNVSSGSCDTLYGHYWTITPNSGYTLGAGAILGSSNGFLPNSQFGYDWQSWAQGSLQLPLTWTTPGTYQLTLHVGNDCGIDTMTQTICVVAPTIASFTLPVNTGCSPVTITPVNNSSVPGCNNSNFYNWSVISTNPQNCTTLGGPAVAPANSNLATPNFNFTGPGVYTVQLITGLNTAIAGNSCVNDTMALTVTIKASPMVSITPPAPICAGASFTPVLTANVCYGTPPITYAWNFNPNNNIPLNSQPNPLTSNLQNPGAITYPANGTFPFSVSATNECGTTTANSTIVVQPGAIVTPGSYGPFCMGSSVQLNGTVSGGSQTGTWSTSVAGATFTPNANALNAVFTPPPNFVGNAVLSLSSGIPPAPCQVTVAQTVISFQTQATVVPGNYSAICMNQVLTLAGQIGGAASSATWTSNVGGTFSNPSSLTSTYTPPVGYVGNIILTLTTNDPAGPCIAVSSTVTIVVNPIPVATVSPLTSVICSGAQVSYNLSSTLANTNYSWQVVTPLPAGVTASTNGTVNSPTSILNVTVTNNSTATQTISYTITPILQGCSGTPITTQITVQPVATNVVNQAITVCPGAAISPAAFASVPVGSTFAWSNTNINIGLGANGNGNIPSWNAPSNNTNVPIVGTISVAPTYNGCVGTASNFVVTINPTPSVTNVVLAQGICSGAPTTAVTWTSGVVASTFAWTAVGSSGSVSGFSASGSGNLPVINGITNSSNTNQTITYTVTATQNGCSGPSIQYVITVYPTPVLTLSANQTVCGGVATAPSTFQNTVAGGSYTYALQSPGAVPATLTGYPTTGSGQVPASTINNSGTNPYTLTYTITPTANGCSGSTGAYTITVNPAPVTTFSPGNQSICSGQNTNVITLGSSTAGVTFTWSIPGGVPAGLANVNVTSGTSTIPAYQNLTNNTIAPLVLTVVAVATTGGASQCAGSPSSYTITVNPVPTAVATFVSNDTICSNSTIDISLTSNTPNTSFTWTALNGINTSGGANSVNPGISIQQSLVNNSTNYGNVTYTITPIVAGACPGQPIQAVAYVHPVATIAALTSPTVCPQATITPTVFVSTPNGASFTWTVSNAQLGINGPGNGQLAPWTAPANNSNAPITGTITVTPTFNGCVGTANNFTVTISPTPTVTNSPLNQTVCEGVATSPITFTSNLNGSSFAWNYLASGANLSGFNAGNGSNPLPPMTVAHSGNTPQTVTYSVIPTSTNNCSGTAVTYTVNVNPNPSVSNVVDQVICSGTSTTLSSYQNNVAGGGFTWSLLNANIPNTVSGFLAPSGNNQLAAAVVSNSGTQPYTLNYLITPNAAGCNGQPDTLSITVMPAPAVTFSIPNETVCNNGNSQAVTISTATANTTFAWSVQNPLPNGLGAVQPTTGNTSVIPSFTGLTNNTNQPISFTITASASTTGNAVCPGVPNTYTITVNPTVTALATFVSNDTLCNNTQLNVALSSITPAVQYTWTVVATNGITGASPSGAPAAVIQQTLANATSSIGSVTYTVTPQIGVCNGTVLTVLVYVNPVAVMNPMANLTACPTQALSPAVFGSVPAPATFTWINSNQQVGIPASGNGNIATWNAPANNTLANLSATVTVTPTYNGCVGTSSSFSITVYPTPTVTNSPLNQTVCEGDATAPITFTSNLNGTSFSWSYLASGANLSGFNAGNGSNPLPTMTVAHSGNTPQTVTYSIIPTSTNNCSGTAVTYTINVNPIPVLNNPGADTVCSGLPTAPAAFTADVQGTTFSWTAITPPVGLSGYTASGSGNLSPMTILNSTPNPLQLVYSVTPSANGCSGAPLNYTITVNPSPTVIFSTVNQTICSGDSTFLVNLTTNTNNATIAWSASVPGGLQGVNTLSGTTQIPAYSLINNTQGNLTATFTATASTAGGTVCPGVSTTYTITVSPQNGISVIAVDSSICSGANAQITISSNTAGLTYATTVAASQGITGASNVNGPQISQTLLNSGNTQGTVTYTVTATAPPGSSCPSQTATLPITVEPVASVQYSVPSQSLCSGASSQLVNLTSNVVGASITWAASVPNGLSGMSLQGGTTIAAAPITSNLNTSAVIGITSSAVINGCTGPIANGQITVFPNPGLTITPPNDTICSGVAAVASLTSNVANTTFAWTISSNPLIGGATNGTGSTINQVLTNNSAQIQQLTYSITTNGPGPNNGCPGQAGTYNIWVNPVASVGFSQLNQTLCSGTSSLAVNILSPTPNAQISWTANIPAGITGAVANGVNTIPAQSLVNNTQGPLTVVYTVNVATQAGNCQGQAATYSITVNPIPVLSFSQNPQVLCSGSNSVAVSLQSNLNAGIPGNIAYIWSANQPVGISGMATSGTNTIPVQTLANNTAAPVVLSYTATLTYTNNNIACNGTGGTYSITVNPLPQVTATVSSPIICSNDTASICFTSPVANANFTWTAVAANGITGAQNGTGSCLNQILVNNLLTQGTVVYTVTASANNCTGSPVTATVSINPNPSVTQVNNIVVCPGQAIPTINFTSTPAGASFVWTNSNQTIGLIGNGSGSISGWQAPVNVSGGAFVGTISVNGTLNGCSGANMSFTVTVNPTPVLTLNPQVQTLCSDSAASVLCTSNVASTSLTWIQASTNVSGASNGNGTTVNGVYTISQTLTSTINTPGSVSYTITPAALGCVGNSEQATVTVNPIPVASVNPGAQPICSGTSTSLILSGNMPGITYGWTVSANNNIVGAFSGSNDTIAQLLTNSSTGNQVITYSITPSLNGCVGAVVNVPITVKPTPILTTNVVNDTICSGTSTNIALSSNVLNTTYSYTVNPGPGVQGAGSGISNPIVQQLTNNTLNPSQVTYEITPSANACDGAMVSVTIIVNPVATVTPSQNSATICSGQSVILQLSSNSPGALFNWSVSSNAQLTGQAAGNGNSINQSITNNSFAVQNFYYVVTPVFGVCPGTQDTIPITVNPLPQITTGPAVNTCASTPPFNLTGFTPPGGTWSGTGITNGQLATFSPAVSGVGTFTLTYSYTNPATGCSNTAPLTLTVNPLPIPSFTMDTLKCANTTVNIVNTSTGANAYSWDFGNGAVSNQVNPLYQFPQGGVYTVWLTATSPQGCVDSVSHSINIISTPSPSYNASTYSGCGPLSVAFTNTTTGSNITSYFWNFGYPTNGPFSSLSNPGTIIFPEPLLNDTTYLVSLSATNICGSVNYIDTILVFPTPNASFAQNLNNGCSPLPVNFINNSTGAPTAYIWNFGDGTFSTATNPSHSFVTGQNDTTYTITLIAINQCGSDTITDTVHVNPNTVTSFFNTTPISGCSPLVVQFTNFSLGAINYFWNFGDGQVSSVFSPSHTYYQSGVITAQLIVDNGCSYDTSNVQITVFAKPVVNFTVVNDTLCSNQAFTFVNSSGALSNTAWDFGDGGTSNVYSPTYTYSQGGNYTVTLVGTSQTNGCLDTNYVMVHVNPSPVLDYDTNQYIGCVPMLVQFNELSNSANFAFWDYDDNNTGIGLSSTHLYNTAGTYNPIVIAQNIYGCTDTATFDVYAYPRPISAFQLSSIQSCYTPLNVSVNNLSQGANAYQWDFGNGFTSALNSPSSVYTSVGNYNVTLISSNQFGCLDTTVQVVNIWPRPTADFIPSTTDGCEDLQVIFENTSSQDANAFLWIFGDGTQIQTFEPSHTYITPGQYDVTLIVMNSFGCFDTLVVNNAISVYTVPQAGFQVSPAIISTEDPTINLVNTASNYLYGTYNFGNGVLQDVNTTQYFYGVIDSGLYVITQIVYSSAGCSDTAYNYIQINLSSTLYVPNSFTPDSDGENDLWGPKGMGIKSIQISIFNRWGEQVFYTNDIYQGWDGTYMGKMSPDGSYGWRIEARDINDELIIKSGHLILIR